MDNDNLVIVAVNVFQADDGEVLHTETFVWNVDSLTTLSRFPAIPTMLEATNENGEPELVHIPAKDTSWTKRWNGRYDTTVSIQREEDYLASFNARLGA